jgi:hypothetical protein
LDADRDQLAAQFDAHVDMLTVSDRPPAECFS